MIILGCQLVEVIAEGVEVTAGVCIACRSLLQDRIPLLKTIGESTSSICAKLFLPIHVLLLPLAVAVLKLGKISN